MNNEKYFAIFHEVHDRVSTIYTYTSRAFFSCKPYYYIETFSLEDTIVVFSICALNSKSSFHGLRVDFLQKQTQLSHVFYYETPRNIVLIEFRYTASAQSSCPSVTLDSNPMP